VWRIRQAVPKSGLVSEEGIDHLRHRLLGKKLSREAIAVFQMNTEDIPKSANTESLAEGQFNAGDLHHALKISARR
jgi:hypothetical protein